LRCFSEFGWSTAYLSGMEIRQPLANLVGGTEEMRLDRPRIEAGRLGDLGDRHLLEVLHHEDRPLPGRQPVDGLSEPLPDLASSGAALGRGPRGRRELLDPVRLLALTRGRLVKVEDEAAPLEPVLAPVDTDPGQPGLEGGALPEVVEVLVRPQEALLRRAVGLAGVAQEAVGDSGDLLLVLADGGSHKVGLPGPDLLDQPGFIDPRFGLA